MIRILSLWLGGQKEKILKLFKLKGDSRTNTTYEFY